MPDYRLKILHFSDLHERGAREKESWRRRRVLGDAWKRNLDEVVSDGPVDIVCLTGDVADWGLGAEYERVTDFIGALRERLALPVERLFLVPGNHDIQRTTARAAWKALREGLHSVPSIEVSRWMAGGDAPRGIDAGHRDQVLERSRAYRAWLESIGLADLLPEHSPHGRLGYRCTISVRDMPFEVHVIGLDSAWMCGGDDDSGRLLLTEDQVAHLATKWGEPLRGFRLALVHHPLSDLADGRFCRDWLAQHADLLLRGHLHEEELAEWSSPDQTLRQIAAGCLYEGHHANHWPNACHVLDITLDASGRPKRYDVRLRGFSDRGPGFWFDDNGLYREARDGRLTWQVTPPSLPSPRRRPGVFVGREAELLALERALIAAEGAPRSIVVVAVFGMAGVGKSYLVEHFCAQHAAQFPGGYLRFVLRPDESRTVDALLADFADRLGIPPAVTNAVERIRARLLRPLVLLHIENADARPAVSAAAALAERLEGCAMVVTGRFQDLGRDVGWIQVGVSPFDEETALEQIEKEHRAARDMQEQQSFRRLARALGYLPLALSLAAGYLRRHYTPDGFLGLLYKKGLNVEPASPTNPALHADRPRAIVATTFELSLELLRSELGPAADRLVPAFASLGHGPDVGFGRSLGEAIAGVSCDDFEELVATAIDLSLLQRAADGEDRWSVHPLLAELLRRRQGGEAALDRMTSWFVERLPELPAGEEALQGQRWGEIERQKGALVSWLHRVSDKDMARVAQAGCRYAIHNGPFQAWMDFCERGLAICADAGERSNLLWVLGNVAASSGAMNRAMAVAEMKAALDRGRGDLRGEALAAGIRADILQSRGQLDEALRIRREQEIPVYEQVGDKREQARATTIIAEVLLIRGQLDEALRMLREQVLPLLEQMPGARERAEAMGLIAQVMEVRGQLDEALRIRREEVLPAYERLGALQGRAFTMGHIARILAARGHLNDALRILRQEVLPLLEQIGDAYGRAYAMGQIADVLQILGQLDEALRIRWKEQLPAYEQLGAVRERAVTTVEIAFILGRRGRLDEAFRMMRQDALPLFERIGDAYACAWTKGGIADVLQDRGDLDEALRLRREEELPVYERLGYVRAHAWTTVRIADVLHSQGQEDEALRLWQAALPPFEQLGNVQACAWIRGRIADVLANQGQLNDAMRHWQATLPLFEQLGSVQARAVTLGKIADVLATQNQMEEALRVRREALALFEQIGDVHARAWTMGMMANVLQTHGQLDEALRIFREALTLFEQTGDVHACVWTVARIADVLQARGQLDEALRVRREEQLPACERLGDGRARAQAMGQIALLLLATGQLDEALRIRRDEELPVYEQLGDAREIAMARVKLALVHLARGQPGDRDSARDLLLLARQAAEASRIPETEQIRAVQERHGLLPPDP